MTLENKFPGKDISLEDIKTKFPLAAKKNKNHKSKFKISGVEFGSKLVPIFAGPNMVESEKLIINCAKNVKKLGTIKLKKCGLSIQKARGIKELSIKFNNKSFDPKLIEKMNDEEAIEYLSTLRQIGRWSAEMILLFTFNRSNIWPVQDIGLLRAISNSYKKKYLPPQKFVNFLKKKFSPYCSVATWYLWRSIDDEPIQY